MGSMSMFVGRDSLSVVGSMSMWWSFHAFSLVIWPNFLCLFSWVFVVCLYVSVCPGHSISVSLGLCLSVRVMIYPSFSVCLSVHLDHGLPISVCLLFVHPFIHHCDYFFGY